MNVAVRLPAVGNVLNQSDHFQDQGHLACFPDASHSLLRLKRRRISRGVLTTKWFCCENPELNELFALRASS